MTPDESRFELLYMRYPECRSLNPGNPAHRVSIDHVEETLRMRVERLVKAVENIGHNMNYGEERRLRKQLEHWDSVETAFFQWRQHTTPTDVELTPCRTPGCPSMLTKRDLFLHSGYCCGDDGESGCLPYAQRGERPPFLATALPRPVWNDNPDVNAN